MARIIAVTVIVLVGLALFLWWWFRNAAYRAAEKLQNNLMEEIKPVWRAVYDGQEPDPAIVRRFAADPRTREMLFDFFVFHQREDIFPKEFRTHAAFGEGKLVVWLMHPNELGSAPDEIELAEEIHLKDSRGDDQCWLLYRFRVHPPHWAAEDGWIAGVVGPIPKPKPNRELFPEGDVVFSLFTSFEAQSPTAHVEAVRDLFVKNGMKL